MIIRKSQRYKLVEFDKGFVILHADDNLQGRVGMLELIEADLATIAEYLNRYCEFRAKGCTVREAHQRALHGAHVIAPGALDLPEGTKLPQ